MKAKIICKNVKGGNQAFFVKVDGKEYFLFQQGYRKSVHEYFSNGVSVGVAGDYSSAHSTAVRRTLDKLPTYIHYIEKEYGVAIYEKSKKHNENKKKKPYKRQSFRPQDYYWVIAC